MKSILFLAFLIVLNGSLLAQKNYSINAPSSECYSYNTNKEFDVSGSTNDGNVTAYEWSTNESGGSFANTTAQATKYTTTNITQDKDIVLTLKFKDANSTIRTINFTHHAYYLPGAQFVVEKSAVANSTQNIQNTSNSYNLYEQLVESNQYNYQVSFVAFDVFHNATPVDPAQVNDHISNGRVLNPNAIDPSLMPMTFKVRALIRSETGHCEISKDFTVTLKVVDGFRTLPSYLRPNSPLPICQSATNFDFHMPVSALFCAKPTIYITYKNNVTQNVTVTDDGIDAFTGLRLWKFSVDPSRVDESDYLLKISATISCAFNGGSSTTVGYIPVTPLTQPKILGLRQAPVEYDPADREAPIDIDLCKASLEEINMKGFPSGGYFLIYKVENGIETLLPDGFSLTSLGGEKTDEFKFTPHVIFTHDNFANENMDIKFRVEYNYPENTVGACPDLVNALISFTPSNDTDFEITSPTPFCDGSILDLEAINNDAGDKFIWEFRDANDVVLHRTVESTDTETSYKFDTPGIYKIRLKSSSANLGINECNNDIMDTIRYGARPDASFTVNGLINGEISTFEGNNKLNQPNGQDDDSDPDDIFRWFWNLNTEDPSSPWIESPQADAGVYVANMPAVSSQTYKVSLVTMAGWGCTDTTYRYLPVFSSITSPSAFPFIEDFDTPSENNSFYNTKNYEQGTDTSSWENRLPPANYDYITSSSMAWFTSENYVNVSATGYRAGYYNKERSGIETPYFNLNAIDRPMVLIDLWCQLDGNFDGAVLQYSIEGENFGEENWYTIGDISSGLNWYNSNSINAEPGRQYDSSAFNQVYFTGWTGTTDTADWKQAAYPLDAVKLIANGKRIRFRISFAANGDNFPGNFDGFGFDNFRIENRTRMILMESFVSSATISQEDLSSVSSDPQAVIIRNLVQLHASDAPIGNTDIANYNFNKADPGVRALHYGLNQLPRTIMDGTLRKDALFPTWGEDYFALQCLKIAPFDFTGFQADIINGELEIKVNLSNTRNIQLAGPYTVQVAIVSQNGKVLRKLLPTAAGTRILNENWNGNIYDLPDYHWNPVTNLSLTDGIQIVCFVQNETTKEILQSFVHSMSFSDLTGITHLPDPTITQGNPSNARIADIIPVAAAYPNPANSELFVEFESPISNTVTYSIQNNVGIEISNGIISNGVDLQRILVSNLQSGFYSLTLKTSGDSKTLSFVKQ